MFMFFGSNHFQSDRLVGYDRPTAREQLEKKRGTRLEGIQTNPRRLARSVPARRRAPSTRARVMASPAVTPTSTLRPASGTSPRVSHVEIRARGVKNDAPSRARAIASLASRGRVAFAPLSATPGATTRSSRRATVVAEASRDAGAADEPAPSPAPAPLPRPVFELGAKHHASSAHASSPGASFEPPAMSPGLAAGVALVGAGLFAAARRRAADRAEEAELKRKFRGELIRRRLRGAVGRGWQGQTARVPGAATSGDERDSRGNVDAARSTAARAPERAARSPSPYLGDSDPRLDPLVVAARARASSRGRPRPRGPGVRPRGRPSLEVSITLGVTCSVRDGQFVAATGAPEALGAWDLQRAATLDRVGADRWQCAIRVPPGPVEYRYVLATVLPGGEIQLESELGAPRSLVAASGARKSQLFVDEAPRFRSRSPAGLGATHGRGPVGFVDAAAARRVAARHAVDLDVAMEIMELVRNDESLADKMLATASRGLNSAGEASGRSSSVRSTETTRSYASTVNVAERLRARGAGGQLAAAAAAMGSPEEDDVSEVYVSDDVRVVEDFSDVSDDELAQLVADLQKELADGR